MLGDSGRHLHLRHFEPPLLEVDNAVMFMGFSPPKLSRVTDLSQRCYCRAELRCTFPSKFLQQKCLGSLGATYSLAISSLN
jgi:hypothetical protein